jgi:hypothetical protein
MALQTFDGIPDVNRAMRRYLVHAETQMGKKSAERKLAQDTFDRLEQLADSPSPVDSMVNTAELLYARRNELDTEGRGLAYGLFSYAYQMGFHGLRDDNRGMRIAQSMARDDGEAGDWPAADTDPGARPEFIRREEEAAPAAPPPPPAAVQPPAADA